MTKWTRAPADTQTDGDNENNKNLRDRYRKPMRGENRKRRDSTLYAKEKRRGRFAD